ncbi:MAG: uL15 family ribosomal protein [Cyanobacteria bacterium]|jgi:large subunit ribosomal protein L15|nr:uL15 family ribosomal protein [Cyanobacteriota bacterium]
MVIRKEKKNRKFLGTRRWGVGNIKNARGAGDRGGVGKVGKLTKHDFTYITAKEPWLIHKKGFPSRKKVTFKEISLKTISAMLESSKEQKPSIELKNYKVLSNGVLEKPAIIKASKFSKQAVIKIKDKGGEAVVIK